MTDYDEFDAISQEASKRLRAVLRGVQGQQTTKPEHGFDFWVYVVTKERIASTPIHPDRV